MTREQRKAESFKEHCKLLRLHADIISVKEDADGRWEVKCYQKRMGREIIIGGSSSLSSYAEACGRAKLYQTGNREQELRLPC